MVSLLLMQYGWSSANEGDSPIASLLGDDSPKLALKGGLFNKIPVPGYKAFEQEEPSWMKIV
jgi:hypothetical protein